MSKKILTIILALTLSLSLAACGDQNADEKNSGKNENSKQESASDSQTGEDNTKASDYEPQRYETDDLTWEFDAASSTLYIHGQGPMRDYSQEAPEWEQYSDDIMVIELDDGITSVGAYAFYNYLALTDVVLPDSIEVIDVSAFDYSWALQSITIPASLKYVGERAFYNTLIWTPENLVFPEGCEYIGDYAFHSALKSGGYVSLPGTLEYLGDMAFTNSCISDFIVAEGNANYCSKDHAIYTKDMKRMIMLAPFADNPAEFRVPDGVEKIDSECFNLIQSIETVYIPASVKEIEEGAFFSTFTLKEIVVDEANANYRSENGLLLSKDGTLLLAWPDGIDPTGKELVIPDGVKRLGEYLFYGRYEEGYSVVLPEGFEEIGTMSLPGFITTLSLPSSLKKIDSNVFFNGIQVDSISYDGTKADWDKITVGEGNDTLEGLNIRTK